MLCLMAVGGQPRERKLTDRCSNSLQPISMMRQIWMASFVAKCVWFAMWNGSMAKLIAGGAMEAAAAEAWQVQWQGQQRMRETWESITVLQLPKKGKQLGPPGLLPFQTILVEVAAVIVNQEDCLRNCCLGRGQTEIPLRQGDSLPWTSCMSMMIPEERQTQRIPAVFANITSDLSSLCVAHVTACKSSGEESGRSKVGELPSSSASAGKGCRRLFSAASAVPDRPCWSTLPAKPCSQNLQRPMQICLHPQSQRAEVRCHCHLARGAWPLSCPACNSARVAYWKARFWLQLFQPHGSPTLWKFTHLFMGFYMICKTSKNNAHVWSG